MTTTAEAYSALRTRLTAGYSTTPIFWQNENNQLPDDPVAFVFAAFSTSPQSLIATGGGRGGNLFRTYAALECFVFVPLASGIADALTKAESIAALFRGQRFSGISCEAVQIDPSRSNMTARTGRAITPPSPPSSIFILTRSVETKPHPLRTRRLSWLCLKALQSA